MDKNLLYSSLSVLPSLYARRKIYHYNILGLFLASISSMNLHKLLLGVTHALINVIRCFCWQQKLSTKISPWFITKVLEYRLSRSHHSWLSCTLVLGVCFHVLSASTLHLTKKFHSCCLVANKFLCSDIR